MISVIVRAYNEAFWLPRVFRALANQRRNDLEVIFVDNESSDGSPDIARSAGAKVVTISRAEFSFGRALNRGIEVAKGDILAILSAHCVPADDLWADYLAIHFGTDDDAISGVYGRQEPLPDSSDINARDLWTTFRGERQIQAQDYFFHNANAAIRRSHWTEQPFDEAINGVEDRAWAKQMIRKGRKIVYEPGARVYHFHGIHQDHDPKRARRVVESIRYIQEAL